MKKTLLFIATFLLTLSLVSAETIYADTPYSDMFTPEKELGKTLSQIKTELNIKSCYTEWQSKNCQYLYYAYAIVPSTSNDIRDALLKEAVDVTNKTTITLTINQFIPPKGVLYYVITFIVATNHTYNDATEKWSETATIPTQYSTAHSIRNICPPKQMLDFDMNAGEYKCYIAQRICIDNLQTGMCTDPYPLYALDKNENGIVDATELIDATNFCADRKPQDFICDNVVSLMCDDNCALYESGICVKPTPNQICDIYDQLAPYSCIDDPLSPNSKICDNIDAVCPATYNPVCTKTNQTFPNKCFAEAQGHTTYEMGACEPKITQCWSANDCYIYAKQLCIGGSTTGIDVTCINYMCTFSGSCSSLKCVDDADCVGIELPCIGVRSYCNPSSFCSIEGSCLSKPELSGEASIWDLILQIWSKFIVWVRSVISSLQT